MSTEKHITPRDSSAYMSIDDIVEKFNDAFLQEWGGSVLLPHFSSFHSSLGTYYPDEIIRLDSDTPFGNLHFLWFSHLDKIKSLNMLIDDINKDFAVFSQALKDSRYDIANGGLRQQIAFNSEGLVHHMRVTSDKLLSLIKILEYQKINAQYPDEVPSKHLINTYGTKLKSFDKMIRVINNVDNAHKHTLMNDQLNMIVQTISPTVVALYRPQNRSSNKGSFYQIILSDTIDHFNDFLMTCTEILRSLTEEKSTERDMFQ